MAVDIIKDGLIDQLIAGDLMVKLFPDNPESQLTAFTYGMVTIPHTLSRTNRDFCQKLVDEYEKMTVEELDDLLVAQKQLCELEIELEELLENLDD